MADDFREGVIHQPFRDVDEAKIEGEAILAILARYERRLGTSALSASAIGVLTPVAEQMQGVSERIVERVEDLEEKEIFGDEESYWNTFRFFCVEGNRGTVRTIGELWDHLALSFDMTNETLETLAETLAEWKSDIEADAKAKYGSSGVFTELGGGFVFYEEPLSVEKSRVTVRKVPIKQLAPRPAESEVVEDVPELEPMDEIILTTLATIGGVGKQAAVIKMIMNAHTEFEREDVLRQIDKLSAAGKIHKFKPSKDRPAFLALDVDRVLIAPDTEISESPEKVEEVDVELAEEVLRILTERNRKPGQMMATSQMINKIEFPDRIISIRQLNAIARLLEEKNLAYTDTGSPLTGKQSRSRSRSRSVFRVGIPTSETMQLVRGILADRTLTDYVLNYDEQ